MDRDTSLFKPQWFVEGASEPNSPMAVFIDPSVDGIKKSDYKVAVFVSRRQTEAGDVFVIEHGVFVQGSDREFFGQFWGCRPAV